MDVRWRLTASSLALLLSAFCSPHSSQSGLCKTEVTFLHPSLTLAYATHSLRTPPIPIPSLFSTPGSLLSSRVGFFCCSSNNLGSVFLKTFILALPSAWSILPSHLLAKCPGTFSSGEISWHLSQSKSSVRVGCRLIYKEGFFGGGLFLK